MPPPRSPARAGRRVLLLVALLVGAALPYLPLMGYRWDYLGHFATGAGLALVLMVGARVAGIPVAAAAPASAASVVLLSIAGEAIWFSHLFFDWGDIGAGGLGAALVAAWALGDEEHRLPSGPVLALAVVLVIAGVVLRFGFDDVGALT